MPTRYTPKAQPLRLMPTADDALTEERIAELARCYQEPAYFIHHYCMIYDAVAGAWVPFRLWDAQADALAQVHEHQLSIILKARQIGMTWLMLSYALWLMLFRPIASILVFSRRDTDAAYLISFDRMRGIYGRLPAWMVAGNDIVTDNVHEWSLANGSTVRAFPTTAGDSYTATLAIVDEADLPPDLNKLLRAVKPTIDNGGKMVLLSRSDKSKPVSEFKRIYREAKAGKNHWRPIFLPWWVHPGRTEEWYAAQKIEIESRTGSLDDLYEQYPACLTAENLISTEQGILPIAEAGGCKETESGKILDATQRITAPVYKLCTAQGRILRGTADHPVMTDGGFVDLAALQPGMQIMLRPPRFAQKIYKVCWQPVPGAKTIVEITPEWGRFIGFFMGDGSWYADTVEIACDGKDGDVLEELQRLTVALLGIPHIRTVTRKAGSAGCCYVRIGVSKARDIFYRLQLIHNRADTEKSAKIQPKRWVHVPVCIFRSPQPVVREFLRGLFEADGSASGGYVSIASAKEGFLSDVQLLLLGFGINSTLRKVLKKAGNGSRYPQSVLTLNQAQSELFVEKIGFIGKRKRAMVVPQATKPKKNQRGWWRYENRLADCVLSVSPDGEEATYNLTVEGEHVFSANGILTHNTDAEAMQPRSTDKRIPAEWLAQVYFEEEGYSALGMAGLTLYRKPEGGRVYVIGCDPAEGNPNSDDSAATVLDVASGEEVAVLAGKFQPSTFAAQVIQLANFYSQAGVLVERNNHGHAVLLALNESGYLNILPGFDEKSGWHSTSKGKALLYSAVTDAIQAKDVIIHSFDTYAQLASIEGSTLRAPDNQYDDRADSFALAQVGREILMRDNVVLRSIRVAGRRGVGEERRRVIRRTSLRRQVRSRERDYEYWAI